MKNYNRGRPIDFKTLMTDFTQFDFSNKKLPKSAIFKNADRLVKYFGWTIEENGIRISKQSKVNDRRTTEAV